jgi:hypothetical protein
MPSLLQRLLPPSVLAPPSSPDVSGQAYAFLAMTPVLPGERSALAEHLRGLGGNGRGPFARLGRTHFARLLVVDDFHHDRTWGQRHEDHLDLPYLVFSACLDGELDSWLDELAVALAPEVPQIWGRCVGGPAEPSGLKAYLLHNRISTGLFFAAYGGATVEQVRASLATQSRLVGFARRAQAIPPQDLQRAFLGEFAPADTPTRTTDTRTADTRTADTRTADSGSRA